MLGLGIVDKEVGMSRICSMTVTIDAIDEQVMRSLIENGLYGSEEDIVQIAVRQFLREKTEPKLQRPSIVGRTALRPTSPMTSEDMKRQMSLLENSNF